MEFTGVVRPICLGACVGDAIMRDMEWYVFVEDINGRKIAKYNIFDHDSFMKGIRKAYKKYRNDRGAFDKEVKSLMFYYFHSKCEWEVIISSWPPSDRIPEIKVDVYEQVMLNWDVFIEYVWTRCHERKRRDE